MVRSIVNRSELHNLNVEVFVLVMIVLRVKRMNAESTRARYRDELRHVYELYVSVICQWLLCLYLCCYILLRVCGHVKLAI